MWKLLAILFCSFYQTVSSLIPSKCYEVIPIPQVKTLFGESPHWDAKTQSLYYCDIFGVNNTIFRFDYKEGRIYPAIIENEQMVSFIIPLKCCPNQFAVGLGRGIKIIFWDGRSPMARVLREVFQLEQDSKYSKNHIHHGKADAKGRFYGGTFRKEICSFSNSANAGFYRYTKQQGVKRLMSDVKVSSGLAWNEDARKFYYIDTCKYAIEEYDWSPKTGRIYNRRLVFNFYDGSTLPTYCPLGMNIDRDGNLWVAMYNTSSIWKINPRTSKVLQTIELPTPIFGNLAIGGPKLDTLFVTTGTVANDIFTGAILNNPLPASAGMLIMVKGICAKGYPGRKICL